MKILKLLLRAHEYSFYRISSVFGTKAKPELARGASLIAFSNGLYLMNFYFYYIELKYQEDHKEFIYEHLDYVAMAFTLLMYIIYIWLFHSKYNLYRERWQNESKNWKFINGWMVALYIIGPMLYIFFSS